MNIDMGHALKNFHGETLREDPRMQRVVQLLEEALAAIPDEAVRTQLIDKANGVQAELTLWNALTVVAGTPIDGMPPDEMGRLFTVVCKLPRTGPADLDAKDIALLQKAVGKVYKNPLYAGQITALLDGKDPFA